MLPLAVYAVLAFGWIQGLAFVWRRPTSQPLTLALAAGSLGPPGLLLGYRLACFAWGLGLGGNQLMRVGPWLLSYATVWSWWLLTLYFGLSSVVSIKALVVRRRERAGTALKGRVPSTLSLASLNSESPAQTKPVKSAGKTVPGDGPIGAMVSPSLNSRLESSEEGSIGRLERAMWAIYHVAGPMTLVIDSMTWLVLMPMLMATPDQKQRDFFYRQHHNFESYNQHGFNAVMILGELLLNRLPVDFFQSGWLALWASLYAAWSTLFFYIHGRFIYPFLDAHKPYAWLAYLGLYSVHWAAFLLFMGLARAKEWVVSRVERRAGAISSAEAQPLLGGKQTT